MNKLIKYYCLSIIFLSSCAHIAAPDGGPPDKTPPAIVSVSPADKTLNFDGDEIVIEFDKYMNNNSVNESIFIIPELKLNFDWSGKELTVELADKPDTNTTYALSLGTGYSDYYGNKPAESFTLVFSTGSRIDSGSIKGFLQDRKPDDIDVYAYRIDGMNPDTLNMMATKAEYRTQVGSSGAFSFMALKNGKYRVLAVRDQFRDGIYTEGVDGFGTCTADIDVKQDSVPVISLKIGSPVDKIRPKLNDAESVKNRIVLACLDEKPDSLTLSNNSFILTDSTGTDTIRIISAVMNKSAVGCAELIAASGLDTAKTWKLTAVNSGSFVIKDSSGNAMDDSSNFRYFKAIGETDYPKPQISTMPFRDSSQQVTRTGPFNFPLSTPVSADVVYNRIGFIGLKDSSAVDYDLIMYFDNIITLMPKKPLDHDQWYRINIDFRDLAGILGVKSKDTTYRLDFKTEDTRSYAKVSGILKDSSHYGGNYFIVLESADSKFRRTVNVLGGGNWAFEEVPPGEYQIEVFCDTDRNSAYSYGNVYPFRFSEPFSRLKQSVTVKPRWNVEDIRIVF